MRSIFVLFCSFSLFALAPTSSLQSHTLLLGQLYAETSFPGPTGQLLTTHLQLKAYSCGQEFFNQECSEGVIDVERVLNKLNQLNFTIGSLEETAFYVGLFDSIKVNQYKGVSLALYQERLYCTPSHTSYQYLTHRLQLQVHQHFYRKKGKAFFDQHCSRTMSLRLVRLDEELHTLQIDDQPFEQKAFCLGILDRFQNCSPADITCFDSNHAEILLATRNQDKSDLAQQIIAMLSSDYYSSHWSDYSTKEFTSVRISKLWTSCSSDFYRDLGYLAARRFFVLEKELHLSLLTQELAEFDDPAKDSFLLGLLSCFQTFHRTSIQLTLSNGQSTTLSLTLPLETNLSTMNDYHQKELQISKSDTILPPTLAYFYDLYQHYTEEDSPPSYDFTDYFYLGQKFFTKTVNSTDADSYTFDIVSLDQTLAESHIPREQYQERWFLQGFLWSFWEKSSRLKQPRELHIRLPMENIDDSTDTHLYGCTLSIAYARDFIGFSSHVTTLMESLNPESQHYKFAFVSGRHRTPNPWGPDSKRISELYTYSAKINFSIEKLLLLRYLLLLNLL